MAKLLINRVGCCRHSKSASRANGGSDFQSETGSAEKAYGCEGPILLSTFRSYVLPVLFEKIDDLS